jgi:hypothetical protein
VDDPFLMPTLPMQVVAWREFAEGLLSSSLCFWLVWWARPVRRWQMFFVVQAIVVVEYYFHPIVRFGVIEAIGRLQLIGWELATAFRFVFEQTPFLPPAVALALAIILDRRGRIDRHWSHWAGVAAWLAFIPSQIVHVLINAGWLASPYTFD